MMLSERFVLLYNQRELAAARREPCKSGGTSGGTPVRPRMVPLQHLALTLLCRAFSGPHHAIFPSSTTCNIRGNTHSPYPNCKFLH